MEKKYVIIIIAAIVFILYLIGSLSNDKTSYSSSSNSYGYGYPKAGESFSDYVKREDPELYAYMEGRYDAMTGK